MAAAGATAIQARMATSAMAASAISAATAAAISAAAISGAGTSAVEATSRQRSLSRCEPSRLSQLLPARHLALHDLPDEPDHTRVAANADLTAPIRVRPVLEAPLRHELVELRATYRDVHARVGGGPLRDLRPGRPPPPNRHVAAVRAQLEPQHELQVLQRRHLRGEAFECLADQRARVLGTHCR